MRKLFRFLFVMAMLGAGVFFVITEPVLMQNAPPLAAVGRAADASNGKTLFYAGGCASCHATTGQDDRTKLGGGLTLHSPFGAFHAPNISPHARDGIGKWTEKEFANAMARGVSPAGEHYYPAFPFTSYQRMTGNDLADLFSFMKTLPMVEGRAPPHDLPFPFNIRRSLGGWKFLFLDGKDFAADPAKSPEWNRGAYLVEGPGHCAECHSPRNILGGIERGARFSGGPDPEGKGQVPNITPHENGLASWKKSDIMELLKTGFTPSFDSAGGSMAAVIKNTAQLSDADRAAMAEYLSTLPPQAGRKKGPR